MNGTDTPRLRGETYLEFMVVGAYVRVVAIDAATGTEVTVAAPRATARADLERLAIAKLERRLAREAGK